MHKSSRRSTLKSGSRSIKKGPNSIIRAPYKETDEERGTSMFLMEFSMYSKSPRNHPDSLTDKINKVKRMRAHLRLKNQFHGIEKFRREKRKNEIRINKMRERMLFRNRAKMLDNKLKNEMAKLAIEKYKSKHRDHKWGLCTCKKKSDIPISRYYIV